MGEVSLCRKSEKLSMIKKAAILFEGAVFSGKRHSDIINKIAKEKNIFPVKGIQGFLTENDEFVNREEAARIAFDSGQLKVLKRKLCSEDLW
jgi:hypothetical protein